MVTQTIAAEGDGVWKEYAGGYTDWATYKASVAKDAPKAKVEAKPATKAVEPVKAVEPAKPKGEKLSWKEQRELDDLPGKVAGLEAEQAELGKRLADASLYQTDPAAAQKASDRLAAIDDELMVMLDRWEGLEARAGNPA